MSYSSTSSDLSGSFRSVQNSPRRDSIDEIEDELSGDKVKCAVSVVLSEKPRIMDEPLAFRHKCDIARATGGIWAVIRLIGAYVAEFFGFKADGPTFWRNSYYTDLKLQLNRLANDPNVSFESASVQNILKKLLPDLETLKAKWNGLKSEENRQEFFSEMRSKYLYALEDLSENRFMTQEPKKIGDWISEIGRELRESLELKLNEVNVLIEATEAELKRLENSYAESVKENKNELSDHANALDRLDKDLHPLTEENKLVNERRQLGMQVETSQNRIGIEIGLKESEIAKQKSMLKGRAAQGRRNYDNFIRKQEGLEVELQQFRKQKNWLDAKIHELFPAIVV
ncbi:MAG: hypothetical protein WAM28_06055 [Chlamydiales bacterium]